MTDRLATKTQRREEPAQRTDVDALSRELLGRIADKWTLMIVIALEDGPLRFTRLKERVEGISQKVLTQTLRRLERDGLVERSLHAAVPPRVEYRLTPLGASLGEAACPIWLWAEKHAADVEARRRAFDARP